jgi:hypothetical protein
MIYHRAFDSNNYLAQKNQIANISRMVAERTMTRYESKRLAFSKSLAKQTHRNVAMDLKQQHINNAIDDDLRFFKANYNAKQYELY